jgi:hypothetical protein
VESDTEQVWHPANDVEFALLSAVSEGDARGYARTVLSAPLYVPMPPTTDNEGWLRFVQGLGLDFAHVQAFTSFEGMSTVVTPFVSEYREGDFATLARFWPDPEVVLAINPGLPIEAVMPLNALTALAEGDESVLPAGELVDAVAEETQKRVRQACLTELGDGTAPTGPEPAGELEILLAAAADRGDANAFLESLLDAEVVVPTTHAAENPDMLTDTDVPWRIISVGGLPVIPVFTSTAMLDRVATAEQPRARVQFITVLACWPSEEHVLCLNPTSQTELLLSGEAIEDLISSLTGPMPEQGAATEG